jgi:glycosyltransferase involved in cell wall biosynthesis
VSIGFGEISARVKCTAADSISIVLAAYNEGLTLRGSLERIVSVMREGTLEWELIAVDDGSSDETAGVLREFSVFWPGVLRTVTHPQNRGLVAAMKTGAEAARLATVVYLDADLSYEPSIVAQLVAAKTATGAAVAVASPYMRGGRVGNVPLDRLIASRGANWLLALCAGGRMHTFTGMVRAYDAEVLRELFSRAPVGEFNTWAIAACVEADRRIVEIPAALIWPRERYAAPSRISARKLVERAKLVLVTARYLLGACRRSKLLKTGTLVLSQ